MAYIPRPNGLRPRSIKPNTPIVKSIQNNVVGKINKSIQQPIKRPVVRNNVVSFKPVKHEQQTRNIPKPSRPSNIIKTQPVVKTSRIQKTVKGIKSAARLRNDKVLQPHVDKIKNVRNKGVGRILVMLACGPSINEIDTSLLKNLPMVDTLSINKPDSRIWPTTYWSFCDHTQYSRNKEIFDAYNGTIFNSSSIKTPHRNQILIRNKSGKGFSRDLTQGYYIGRSTTFASMQIALWLGYSRIYILGCDMAKVGDKLHFYGVNPDVQESNRQQRFSAEAQHYAIGADALTEEERSRFYFCSSYNKYPFIDRFNRLHQNDAIQHILEYDKLLRQK